jgi:hypothetical protein
MCHGASSLTEVISFCKTRCVEYKLHQLEKKIKVNKLIAINFQQRASGPVVKTTSCVMCHTGSRSTEVIL